MTTVKAAYMYNANEHILYTKKWPYSWINACSNLHSDDSSDTQSTRTLRQLPAPLLALGILKYCVFS